MRLLRPVLLLCAAAAAALLPWIPPAVARDVPPSRREIVESVIEIVNRPEFEGSEEEEEGLLLVLANMLSDFLDRVKDLRRTDPVVYGTLLGWLVLTVAAILGHIAWTVWKGGAAGSASARRAVARVDDPAWASREARDPGAMLARAEEAVRAEDRRSAAVWLYLALLFRLERSGHLRFDPARTALQYSDALARAPEKRRAWIALLDLHDPVVFGGRPCGDADLARMDALARGGEAP